MDPFLDNSTRATTVRATTVRAINIFSSTTTESREISTTPPVPDEIIYDPGEEMEWATWMIAVITFPTTILILEIILGNLLVIIAILGHRSLRTPSNMLILSLAVADLAVGVFILPFNIADMLENGWLFGTVLCRIWLTSDVTLCSTSILHISAIAVDRFRSINEGVSYAQTRTIGMSVVVCGALWLIALWIASAPVLGWNDWKNESTNGTKMDCHLTRELGYIVHSASGAFFIPAIIMVGLYFRIFLLLRNKLRERAQISCVSSRKSRTQTMSNHDQEFVEDHSSADILEDSASDATKESVKIPANSKPKKSIDFGPPTVITGDGNSRTRKKHSEQIETILKNKLRFSLTKERKAAQTLGVIIGAFIICWTPFTLVYLSSGILVYFNPDSKGVPFWLFQGVTWLGYVNSGLNPIIYTIYNPEFRRAFTTILNTIFCQNK